MENIPLLLKEMEQEALATRKMLKLVSSDNFDYKPHEKSMTMKQLSTHIAEIPSWVKMGLETSELDFGASPYEPAPVKNSDDLMS
ncbi:MAG: DinB family protein, partial [Ginsengibacter sp.]